jgi:pyochelin biosynthesis protein PchC
MHDAHTWFREFGDGSRELPAVLCLPHAGGAAGFFRDLPKALGDEKRVVAVQYPGRQDRYRETPAASVEELATAIAAAVQREMHGEIELLGHSLGALVGYELARILAEAGTIRVRHLTVTNMRAPSVPARPPRLYELGDTEFLDAIARLGAIDAAVLNDAGMVRHVLPGLRADYRAAEIYMAAPNSGISCGITAAAGLRDPLVAPAEVDAWRNHTSGPFRLRAFDVDHFELYRSGRSLPALLLESVRC